jgi:hypothetical protein
MSDQVSIVSRIARPHASERRINRVGIAGNSYLFREAALVAAQ